jgi:hypothetical protein
MDGGSLQGRSAHDERISLDHERLKLSARVYDRSTQFRHRTDTQASA